MEVEARVWVDRVLLEFLHHVAVAVARRVRTCDHHRRGAEHVIDSVVQAKRGSLTTLHVNSQQQVNIIYSWSQPRPEEQGL